MKVLVVEDNFLFAQQLEEQLRQQGCEPIGPYATASAALEALATIDVDGAILDLSIRGGTSISVAEELARRHRPFAFVTGYGDPDVIPEALRNATRLTKPIGDAELRLVVAAFRGAGPPAVGS